MSATPPTGRRALAIAVALASTTWFFASRDAKGPTARLAADAPYYHSYLVSLVFDRDLDFTNEYRVTKNWYQLAKTPRGRPANVFGIGPAIFTLPFFAVGHVASRLLERHADGFSSVEVGATMLASLVYTLGALIFASRLIRRRLDPGWVADLAPILVAVSGPVVYYAIRQPGYSHPFATFFAAWLLDAWDASCDRPRTTRTWLGLGLLLGATALARPQLVLWGVVLLLAAADDLRRGEGLARSAGRWLVGLAGTAIAFAPQVLAWRSLYGHLFVVPQGAGFMRWDAPAWSEVLFSSRNGLLAWAPLYAVALIGLVAALRHLPRLAGGLLLGVALQVIANGAVWDWWAGGSFGGRRFDSCFLAAAFGLAFLVRLRWNVASFARRAASLTVLVAAFACAVTNLALAARTSAPTARIYGGEPAAPVLRAAAPGPFGWIASVMSSAANFPARAAFALRHGSSLVAYDRVVGVHLLGELFPGLNTIHGKREENIDLADAGNLLARGLAIGLGSVVVTSSPARLLVPLNRRAGPLSLSLSAKAPGATPVPLSLWWNGRKVATDVAGPAPTELTAAVVRLVRGVNVLEVAAPPGTRLVSLRLSVPPGASP